MATIPAPTLYPSTSLYPSGVTPTIVGSGFFTVRELPPLRHTIEIETPAGRYFRWADDEPDPANVPSNLRHSSTMPGGYESLDATLPRRPGIDYADLERLSTIRVLDASGSIVSETRLERTPRTSGEKMAVSPSAVGWQANLEDDKSASAIIIDRDISRWGEPSTQRHLDRLAAGGQFTGSATVEGGVIPTIVQSARGVLNRTETESFYNAGAGNTIARILGEYTKHNLAFGDAANWDALIEMFSDDSTYVEGRADLAPESVIPFAFDYTPGTPQRYVAVLWRYLLTSAGADGVEYSVSWRYLRVVGDHGLTLQGTGPTDDGILASDVIAYAVGRWAPALTVTSESVESSGFIIPQLAFYDPTTAGEIVRQATRFGLQDWAVWDNLTFWWHTRGARGRQWRARIAPAQLEETGPQVDRLWTSVIVQYQDVDGSTRTVGPTNSGADTESEVLEDTDTDNPAVARGITRRDLLTMGVGTPASATEIGRRFLEEQKLLDTSGRATFVGHVEDDRGVLHPYSHVRAGDTVTFVDAADPSARRIVRAEHSHASRTCTVDLDSPPEGLPALLERLGVSLVSLGM